MILSAVTSLRSDVRGSVQQAREIRIGTDREGEHWREQRKAEEES
jgi:hypothetical protein